MARILVVDDDVTILMLVERMLDMEGHTVDLAGDGNEALECLDLQVPDLILSDISMPGLDGPNLFREVRARGHQMPFVAMSGHLTTSQGDRLGFDALLPKPFSLEELVEAIGAALIEQPV